jgi:tetratricopeptide (TPR) repeat protein
MTDRRFTPPIGLALAGGLVLLVAISLPAQDPPAPGGKKPVEEMAGNADQLLDEAVRRFDSGDYQEAFVLLQRVKSAAPNVDKLLLVEGLLFAQAYKYAEATSNFEEYNRSKTGRIDWRGYAEVGRLYKESRLFMQAQGPLLKAKELAPAEVNGKQVRARIALDLAGCYFGLNKDKKALEAISDAERDAPNDPEIQQRLAEISFRVKDYPRGMKAVDKAIGLLSARSQGSPFKQEDQVALRGCYDLKIRLANAQIDANPKDTALFFDLAEATREQGEVARRINTLQARDLALKGIAKDPRHFKLQVYLAYLEADLGALQEALDRLNDVISNDPENQSAIKLREDIQARINKTPGA